MDTRTFSALSEPNRLKIIELLRKQPRSVNEVAALLKFNQPKTSKHLNALRVAGLINVRPVAQKHIYSLKEESFLELESWVNSFHTVWGKRLDNLETYLKKG